MSIFKTLVIPSIHAYVKLTILDTNPFPCSSLLERETDIPRYNVCLKNFRQINRDHIASMLSIENIITNLDI